MVNNPSRGSAHIVSNPESANKRDAEISQRRANIFENVMKYTYVYKTSDGAYHENLLPQKLRGLGGLGVRHNEVHLRI